MRVPLSVLTWGSGNRSCWSQEQIKTPSLVTGTARNELRMCRPLAGSKPEPQVSCLAVPTQRRPRQEGQQQGTGRTAICPTQAVVQLAAVAPAAACSGCATTPFQPRRM